MVVEIFCKSGMESNIGPTRVGIKYGGGDERRGDEEAHVAAGRSDIIGELFTNKERCSVCTDTGLVQNIAGFTCFADCFDGLMQIDGVTKAWRSLIFPRF